MECAQLRASLTRTPTLTPTLARVRFSFGADLYGVEPIKKKRLAPRAFDYSVAWAGSGKDGQPCLKNWGTGATSAPGSSKLNKARPTPSAATRRASSASPRRSTGTAAELDLPQLTAARCPCHPCAARAGATPWVPPRSAAAVAADGRSSTRGLDERAPARVSRPRVKPFLDRVFGLASRNHCC